MRYLSKSFICASLVALCLSSAAFAYSGGTGEPSDPYQIADANDWQQLVATYHHWDKSFILTADIDLRGVTFSPVGGYFVFMGHLDGQGRTICNLLISSPDKSFTGLFDMMHGEVRDLRIESATVTGLGCVGALAGSNAGVIIRCNVTGSVGGKSSVGGLAGENMGWITDCDVDVVVGGPASLHNIGGLVGLNGRSISNCQSSGSVVGISAVGGLAGSSSGDVVACGVTSSVSGYGEVGGLIGHADSGTVSACRVTGTVHADPGADSVGGLIGYNEAAHVSYCSSTASVYGVVIGGLIGRNSPSATVQNSMATGSVQGSISCLIAGGLVGENTGAIYDCYATGSVSGGTLCGGLIGYCGSGPVRNCYAVGRVSGQDCRGGLIGYYAGGQITASYWDIHTSTQASGIGLGSSAGVYGRSTDEMKQRATFTAYGWDFLGESANGTADTWRMCTDGVDYPRLTWEYVQNGDFACPDGVAMDDLARLADDWLLSYSWPLYGADATGDSSVTFLDFAVLATGWQKGI